MLTEPLPATLDVRKAAAREATVDGVLALSKMARLQGALASLDGHVEAQIAFSKDEESRCIAVVIVRADVSVSCQRCLESMPHRVESENRLAIVGDDELARQLPSRLEPWMVAGEQGDLWALIEDELILAIPLINFHESEDCNELLKEYRDPPPVMEEAADNTFKVLAQLKPGNK
jgi:uncharacterized protein